MKELYKGGICGLQASEKDLSITWGRASLAIHRSNLYFEKAIGNVIPSRGDRMSALMSLCEETEAAGGPTPTFLSSCSSPFCVSSFTDISPQTAEASVLPAKDYATSGEAQRRNLQNSPVQSADITPTVHVTCDLLVDEEIQ